MTEDAVNLAAHLGADTVEIYIQGEPELHPEMVTVLADRCRTTGLDVISVHPYVFGWEHLLFSNYSRQRAWAQRRFVQYLEICAATGADAYVSHGPPRHHAVDTDGIPSRRYIDIMRDLVSEATARSVRYCLENVSYGLVRAPDDFHSHRDLIPDLGFVVDFKSAWKAGFRPVDFLTSDLIPDVHHTQISFRDDGRYGLGASSPTAAAEDADIYIALQAAVPHVLEIEATAVDQVADSLAAVRKGLAS
ncbi:TIM barrel protein [Nocardia sp. NPDC047038]|uniref:sugar phosphate isomerase/epimerase family protein n=1 Tax=Nocardia sp. NPDC047038 TaxID=3154338 RepID=UPI00340F4C33